MSAGIFLKVLIKKNSLTLPGKIFYLYRITSPIQQKVSYGGLHLQKGGSAQAKLVRVVKGEVLDVAIDLRTGSGTYGQHFSIRISESNNLQLFIPKGFAHGFVVLSDEAVFQYKCDNYYDKAAEGGIHYADPDLAIDWILPHNQLIVSSKDLELPYLNNVGELGFKI